MYVCCSLFLLKARTFMNYVLFLPHFADMKDSPCVREVWLCHMTQTGRWRGVDDRRWS